VPSDVPVFPEFLFKEFLTPEYVKKNWVLKNQPQVCRFQYEKLGKTIEVIRL